jgi:hypothetical protein
MRRVTQAEAAQWTELAREHGHVDDEGRILFGHFTVESDAPDGAMRLRLVTPLVAELYSGATLARKQPPIMFDRAPSGEIIIPGRWWHSMFERLSEYEGEGRATAARVSRLVRVDDIHLPAETDTIGFIAPDDNGNYVVHEALPPGVEITLRIEIGQP